MQSKKWWFGIILVFLSKNLEACPNNWIPLKSTLEGPFYSTDGYQINIDRKIKYKCNHGEIKFHTERWISSPDIPEGYNWKYRISPKCTNTCNEKNATVTVLLQHWSWWRWSEWSKWSIFSYVNTNCNKFYWSSWTKTVNCSISSERVYMRKCVDCDREDFKSKINCPDKTTKTEKCHHSWSTWVTKNCSATKCNLIEKSMKTWDCFFENETKVFNANLCLKNLQNVNVLCKPKWGNLEVLCRPFWSMWMTGNCSGVNCNSTGARVRTRNCLYGDGSNSASIKLCSNQSNIKTEQCMTNFSFCGYVDTQPNSEESSFLSNVGIGVSICIISIIIIVIAVFLKKDKKSKRECLRLRFSNPLQIKSNNHSLSVNEIYNGGSIHNIGLTQNSQSLELASAGTYVNPTCSLDGLKTVQEETFESTYEMAQENGGATHKNIIN